MEKKQYIQPNAKLIEIEAEPCLQDTSTITHRIPVVEEDFADNGEDDENY